MPHDVLTQLRDYASYLDEMAPGLEDLKPATPRASSDRPFVRRRRYGWAIAVVAAGVVLLLIGIPAILTRDDKGVVDETTTTTFDGTTTTIDETPTSVPSTTVPEVPADVGAQWAQVPDPDGVFEAAGAFVVEVVNDDGLLVALSHTYTGDRLAVWNSHDGIDWSQVPHDDAVFGPPPGNDGVLVGEAVVGEPGIVTWGRGWGGETEAQLIWFSPDGFTWMRSVLPEPPRSAMTFVTGVTAGGPGFVAVGAAADTWPAGYPDMHPVVWTSTNGTDWTLRTDATGISEPSSLSTIVGYAGRMWAFGSFFAGDGGDVAVWASGDGVSWERAADDAVLGGPGDQNLQAVAAGPGGVVATGGAWTEEDGYRPIIWYSADGDVWTIVESVPDDPGRYVTDIVATGTGFLAVGTTGENPQSNERAIVLRSEDGSTWTSREDPAFVDAMPHAVTEGGPGLVAVGELFSDTRSFAPVWVSPPGDLPVAAPVAPTTTVPAATTETSTPVTTTAPVLPPDEVMGTWTRWAGDDVFGDVWVADVASLGDDLIAIGQGAPFRSAGVWRSSDGVVWESVADLPAEPGGAAKALAAGDNGVVAVGGVNAWFSTDGTGWSRSTLPDAAMAWDVVATDAGFVTVGVASSDREEGEGAVWTSPDGTTWQREDLAGAGGMGRSAIVATDDGLVAIAQYWDGPGFEVWHSTDGTTWTITVVNDQDILNAYDLTLGVPGLLASEGARSGTFLPGLWFSVDGIEWRLVAEGLNVISVAPRGDGFVAVGYDNGYDDTGNWFTTPSIWSSTDGITWAEETAAVQWMQASDPDVQEILNLVRAIGPGLVAFSNEEGGEGNPVASGLWTWEP